MSPKKRDIEIWGVKPDLSLKTPGYRETETNEAQHRDPKTFFQRTKSYNIEIPKLKSHCIELLQNSDPYAPRYDGFNGLADSDFNPHLHFRRCFFYKTIQFVIFNPRKVPWNLIAFYQNYFVISPGCYIS